MEQQVMLEMSLYQLNRSTQNQFGDARESKSSKMRIVDITYTPIQTSAGQGLVVTSKCLSGDSLNQYEQRIEFTKVKLDDEDTPENATVPSADGKQVHINYRSLASSDVKVRCTCMDFYWRFASYNANKRALSGDRPPPYVKKTNRPPVNPLQKPGVCKHIYKLLSQVIPLQYRQ